MKIQFLSTNCLTSTRMTLFIYYIQPINKNLLKMSKPIIGVVMGSDSDWSTMKQATDILDKFGVNYEKK